MNPLGNREQRREAWHRFSSFSTTRRTATSARYNALRHALAVAQVPETEVRVFLMADATACAVAGQVTPEGYYSIESLLKGLVAKKSQVVL